jgi:hypothetical protein
VVFMEEFSSLMSEMSANDRNAGENAAPIELVG